MNNTGPLIGTAGGFHVWHVRETGGVAITCDGQTLVLDPSEMARIIPLLQAAL